MFQDRQWNVSIQGDTKQWFKRMRQINIYRQRKMSTNPGHINIHSFNVYVLKVKVRDYDDVCYLHQYVSGTVPSSGHRAMKKKPNVPLYILE